MTPLILHIEQQREHDDNEGAGDADDHYQASVHHGGQVWSVWWDIRYWSTHLTQHGGPKYGLKHNRAKSNEQLENQLNCLKIFPPNKETNRLMW